MSGMKDFKSSFAQKLDSHSERQAQQFRVEQAALRTQLMRSVQSSLPADLVDKLHNRAAVWNEALQAAAFPDPQFKAQISLGQTPELREIDATFLGSLGIQNYYPGNRINYPTIYCETLEEFFTPWVAQMNLSPLARQAEIARQIEEAVETAKQTKGGGIMGVNLPGQGCYLNGWLLAYGSNLAPAAALQNPEGKARILSTAIHEKLGHGFLGGYSTLGGVVTQLGLNLIGISQRFGLRPADDPLERLRLEQYNLIYTVSQFLEEGWATWIQTFLGVNLLRRGSHPMHNPRTLVDAIKKMPANVPDRESVITSVLAAFEILFGEKNYSLDSIRQAVVLLTMLSEILDPVVGQAIGQPLRYVLGEWLLMQAEKNLGAACVPFAALIAGNVSINPTQISLSDLNQILFQDARLNPDVRLAALSRMALNQPGSVTELTSRAEAELSFSVPAELKK